MSQTTLIARFTLLFFCKQYLIGSLYGQPRLIIWVMLFQVLSLYLGQWFVPNRDQR